MLPVFCLGFLNIMRQVSPKLRHMSTRLHGVASQKATVFMLTPARTSNPHNTYYILTSHLFTEHEECILNHLSKYDIADDFNSMV